MTPLVDPTPIDLLILTAANPAQARAALQAVTKEDVRSILRPLTLSVSYLLTKEEPTHA